VAFLREQEGKGITPTLSLWQRFVQRFRSSTGRSRPLRPRSARATLLRASPGPDWGQMQAGDTEHKDWGQIEVAEEQEEAMERQSAVQDKDGKTRKRRRLRDHSH